jgi:hypothetical protein
MWIQLAMNIYDKFTEDVNDWLITGVHKIYPGLYVIPENIHVPPPTEEIVS